jgi:hypothetical protein
MLRVGECFVNLRAGESVCRSADRVTAGHGRHGEEGLSFVGRICAHGQGCKKRRSAELQRGHAKGPVKILKRFMGDQDASMPLNRHHTSILNSAPLPVLRTVSRPPMFFSMMVIDMKRPIPVPLSGPLVVK